MSLSLGRGEGLPLADQAVLSIQSQVAAGHVGNSAATLPLQRLGFEVIAINTVQLAHHPGHGSWHGHKVEPQRIAQILDGVVRRGALGRCGAMLSGYLGDAAVGGIVLDARAALRAARPDALYLCDPVIGDDGPGVFVSAGIPELMRDRLVPAADIVTPNRFELAFLAAQPVTTLVEARRATARLRANGPRLVVATGLSLGDDPGLAVLADGAEGAWLVATPRLAIAPGGTGDVFSALFLGHYLRAADVGLALERAVSATFDLVERTQASGADELRLVAAQDDFDPATPRFRAQRLD
ncbi:MAG TPA: pyridoxal kinase PdxY [Geminicoccaceae bacterium]|nr:pyridoxal kinase PdxY [Geminicoccaceae bacterium]